MTHEEEPSAERALHTDMVLDPTAGAQFELSKAPNRGAVDVGEPRDFADVAIEAASARDLHFFIETLAPGEDEAITRPIIVRHGGKRSVIDVTVARTSEGGWRLELGRERPSTDAPDRSERVDARLDELSLMVWLTDAERLARWFNAAWLRFVGATLEDELGWGWMRHVHPDDLRGLLESYEAAQQARHGFEHVVRVTDQYGSLWWLRVRAASRARDGEFDGFIGLCQPLGRAHEGEPPSTPGLADAVQPVDLTVESTASVVDRLATLESALEVCRPAQTIEAAFLRRLASRWLAQHEVLQHRHDEIVLAVGEAAANSALHAYDQQGGLVRLRCELGSSQAQFRIRDWGTWRSRPPIHDGRGLALMHALTDELTINRCTDGTEVVLRYSFGSPERHRASG